MTTKEKIIFIILSILSCIGLALSGSIIIFENTMKSKFGTGAISINGGADGSTSIFLASNLGDGNHPFYIITIILVVVTGIYFFTRKKKHK